MELSFYSNFTNTLTAQEAQISALQQQISTGLKVQTPDQNPAAYQTAALGNDQVSQLSNDNTTQATIQTQLGAANNAYSSATALLDNVQSIVLQALSGTTNSQNLNALSLQVQSASKQLLSVGNTIAPNGSYLFGGSRGTLAPFQPDSSGNIVYFGDSGQSQATIGQGNTANTLVNGEAFTSALAGDGTSVVTANTGNAGTGQMLQQGLANVATANAFQQGSAPITVAFAVAGNTTSYTATQGGTTISTGTLNSGGQTNLQLAGVNYEITGAPANGDSFTVSPARPQSAFALLQQISTALSSAQATPAQVAQTSQVLNQSLAGLAQYQQAVTTAQAQNGVTLQALASAATSNTAQQTAVQTTVNNATAVDMPAAISALDQTMTAVQAAMKTFGSAQSLSLFKYL
ncbi:MAG: flagellar hook-associated protein FlgL [Rhodospirillales bacterium]|nr:flagellar hook-associated protein FlgL [Rhodospirillales bacterium]MDE1883342.1 flagellar hook-associated protein FlgL [Rhodospirillales bacterium]MDE2390690.1 flagellar hook-associated protein FlgL [Rhodospirillales bacterium]MDE2458025.1 flagellar hook-associated protein FlgL [Rhodospirillales bacterium]